MTLRRRWDINTRTQLITLGPALLLTLLLITFFTFVRIQDLRQELDHTVGSLRGVTQHRRTAVLERNTSACGLAHAGSSRRRIARSRRHLR